MAAEAITPMLASTLDWDADTVTFPVVVSAKIDGWRCVVLNGVGYSRKMIPIPNRAFQAAVAKWATVLEGADGEIVVGNSTAPDVFRRTESGMSAADGEPDFQFLLFDCVSNPAWPYVDRLDELRMRGEDHDWPSWAYFVEQHRCGSRPEVEEHARLALGAGFEGIIVRDRYAAYKFGRSTAREGGMRKWKPVEDAEAVVLGATEFQHNRNLAGLDAQGHTKRSSAKGGKEPGGKLGSLQVALVSNPDVKFSVGTGFTDAERVALWKERDTLPGRIVTVQYLAYGTKDGVPRHPRVKGFRSEIDL